MSAPSSADLARTARAALAARQAELMDALVARRMPPGIQQAPESLVTRVTADRHQDNVSAALAFYFPRIAAELRLDAAEWATWFPGNPTTLGHGERRAWFAARLAERLQERPVWLDALRIESAQSRLRDLAPLERPALVAAVRGTDLAALAAQPAVDLTWGTVVETRSTLPDTFWIPGHAIEDAVVFGPPRRIAFFRSPDDGRVQHRFFTNPSDLAVMLCFS